MMMSVGDFRNAILEADAETVSEKARLWDEFREAVRASSTLEGGTPRERAVRLAEAVALNHGIATDVLLGEDRTQIVSVARQELMYELWRNGWSTTRIGRFLKRDHSTVVYGLRRHKERAGLC